jgi:hypothetical protein
MLGHQLRPTFVFALHLLLQYPIRCWSVEWFGRAFPKAAAPFSKNASSISN